MKSKTQTILDVIVFLLMLLFIYASVFKLLGFEFFKRYISNSPFGAGVAGSLALGIPLVELIVACMLFIPRFRLIGLYSSLALMVSFTVYIGYYTFQDTGHRPCACGGILNNMDWTEHLIFNIAFTLLAFVGALIKAQSDKKEYKTSMSH